MLPVVAGRVRPAFAGNIYCQLMTVCHELADLRRAQQWTDATTRWCQGFSSAVMFLGVCRVHRAQLLQIRGEWAQAEHEIQLVCDELADMNVIAVGLALYELAEVTRLRGDLTGAEEAYAEAHRHGRDPASRAGPAVARTGRAHGAALEALRRGGVDHRRPSGEDPAVGGHGRGRSGGGRPGDGPAGAATSSTRRPPPTPAPG